MDPEASSFKIRKSNSQVEPSWSNFYSVYVPVENARPLLITPIISGYQKAERLALTPFLQVHLLLNSSLTDCGLNTTKLFNVIFVHYSGHIEQGKRYVSMLQIENPTCEVHTSPSDLSQEMEYKRCIIILLGHN